jgi:hypothetical protein
VAGQLACGTRRNRRDSHARSIQGAVALGLALALSLGACGGSGADGPAPPAAPSPPAEGFARVVGPGFTVDVPARWQQASLDPATFTQSAAALRAENPQLAQALEDLVARAGTDNGFAAVDPVEGSTLSVLVVEAGDADLDRLAAEGVAELEQVGVGPVQQDRTTLGGRPAARLRFTLPVRGTTGSLDVPETQYYAVHGDRLYILTLFGSSAALDAIAASFRFV